MAPKTKGWELASRNGATTQRKAGMVMSFFASWRLCEKQNF
jgi:hypothetical protein